MKVKVVNVVDHKTFKASSVTKKKHQRYGKYIMVPKSYLVDSGDRQVNVGDEVDIKSSRPLSKRKKWALV
jgi:small subunit ribosomal protein S17